MSWKDIIKNTDRYKRFLDAGKKDKERKEAKLLSRQQGYKPKGKSYERKPDMPKTTCAMCGKKISMYDKNLTSRHKQSKLNFCKTCAAQRGN